MKTDKKSYHHMAMSRYTTVESSGSIYLADSSHRDKPVSTHLYAGLAKKLAQVFGLLSYGKVQTYVLATPAVRGQWVNLLNPETLQSFINPSIREGIQSLFFSVHVYTPITDVLQLFL